MTDNGLLEAIKNTKNSLAALVELLDDAFPKNVGENSKARVIRILVNETVANLQDVENKGRGLISPL